MKKIGLFTLLASALLLSACGKTTGDVTDLSKIDSASAAPVSETVVVSSEATKEATEYAQAVTFTDALGREVSINNPQRVAVLLGSFLDEWILSGGSVVGTVSESFKNYDYDLEGVLDLGGQMKVDTELLISLNPDFVIATASLDAQVEMLETLESAGINVAYFNVDNFGDYISSLDIFTKITGKRENYDIYGTQVAEEIEKAKQQIDGRKPSVLFIRAAASSVKVKGSEGTVGGEILADLDTVNIADSDFPLEDLSIEAIILADPDYIFVTTQGSDTEAALANVDELLINNPAWNSLKAVQNGNFYVLDKELFNSKPNARWGESYKILADIIYPEE